MIMIKANELRKNNWINYKGNPICLIGNYDLFKACVDCERTEDYKPIPLTEEILLKCGFEWLEDFTQEKSLVLELNLRIKIGYYKGNIKCCSMYQDGDCIDLASNSHSHLHQLQNLCLALTGEELKIYL